MRDFLQAVLDGMTAGSLYAMIALGYTLVYGIIKLINFAHGEFYMMGAYIGFFILVSPLAATSSAPLFALILLGAFLASMAGSSLLAVITEKIAYKPLRHCDRIVALLTAIGVSFLLQNVARLVFSPNPRSYQVHDMLDDRPWAALLAWYRTYSQIAGFEFQNGKLYTAS